MKSIFRDSTSAPNLNLTVGVRRHASETYLERHSQRPTPNTRARLLEVILRAQEKDSTNAPVQPEGPEGINSKSPHGGALQRSRVHDAPSLRSPECRQAETSNQWMAGDVNVELDGALRPGMIEPAIRNRFNGGSPSRGFGLATSPPLGPPPPAQSPSRGLGLATSPPLGPPPPAQSPSRGFGLATSSPLGPPPPVQSPSRSFGLATSSPPVQSPSNARRGLHGAPTMLHAPQPHSPSRSPSKRSHITRSMVRSVSLPPIARPIGIAATRGDASERQRGGPWPVAGGTGRPLAAL